MLAQKTLDDVIADVRILVQDPDNANSRWSNSRIIDEINYALREYSRKTNLIPVFERLLESVGGDNATYASTLATSKQTRMVWRPGFGELQATTAEQLLASDPDFRNRSGEPICYVPAWGMHTDGRSTILVWPTPASALTDLHEMADDISSPLSNGNDKIPFPPETHDFIRFGAAIQLIMGINKYSEGLNVKYWAAAWAEGIAYGRRLGRKRRSKSSPTVNARLC